MVWGNGNYRAKLCFIGEGPGRAEDLSGWAFVGAAGKLLIKILKIMDLSTENILILNLVSCRPPENRNPKSDEIEACRKYLDKKLDYSPNVNTIVALGRVPWKGLTGRTDKVRDNHGMVSKYRKKYRVVYTFHPSYLKRNPKDIELKKYFIRDIKKALLLSNRNGISQS